MHSERHVGQSVLRCRRLSVASSLLRHPTATRRISWSVLDFSGIESLVESCVRESTRLDYKRDLPGRTDKDKKEFCEDVAAFANTRGGVIIFGVAEGTGSEDESGVPGSVTGVSMPDPDAEALRLANVLRSGLSPRLSGVDIYLVEEQGEAARRCLVVSVPQSLARPHMVTSGGVALRLLGALGGWQGISWTLVRYVTHFEPAETGLSACGCGEWTASPPLQSDRV